MSGIESGHKVISTKKNQRFILKWQKLSALSEEFANMMSSLSCSGIESFRDVEIEFLSAFPQAIKEDNTLADLENLTGNKLNTAINRKLYRIFHSRPEDLSEQARIFLHDVYYYFVTILDETFNQVLGFVTFMGGGSFAAGEFKITSLAVDKRFRRLGLAGHLVGALKEFGIPHRKLLVTTRPSNKVAIHTYKNLGFLEDPDAENSAPPQFVRGHWIHLKHTLNQTNNDQR